MYYGLEKKGGLKMRALEDLELDGGPSKGLGAEASGPL